MKINNTFSQIKVLFITISFSFYAILGCGNSRESIACFDKYDNEPYNDAAVFPGSKTEVYAGTVEALQTKGYIITLSDPATGLINAEINTPKIIAEEQKESESTESSGTGGTVLTILGIILIFGIIAALTRDSGSSSSKSESESSSTTFAVENDYDQKTESYRYVVSLSSGEAGSDSVQLKIYTLRMQLENGSVVETREIKNKYLNYSIFDGINAALRSGRK